MMNRRDLGTRLLQAGLAWSSAQPITRRRDPLTWTPDTFPWQPDDPPGAKYAVLHGGRDDARGVFTYAFWLPGGVWAPVHLHSRTAHVTVVRGTLRLGRGRVADRAAAVAIPAGGFFVVPADEWHYEGSDGECLIIGTAQGGWTTTVAP